MRRFFLCFLIVVSTLKLFADPEARNIANKYYKGVVKILICDPALTKSLDLKDKIGYLCRGTGFFVTEDGLILTNRHVVEWCVNGYLIADWTEPSTGKLHTLDCLTYEPGLEKSAKIKKVYALGHAQVVVQVFTGHEDRAWKLYTAKVLLMGEDYDCAILQITGSLEKNASLDHFIALPLGDSTTAHMGDDIILLGFPSQYQDAAFDEDLRDTITMTFGKHSGWDYVFDPDGFIKTDARISEGNSGGPVFDDTEKVIGIATGMSAKTHIGLVEQINQLTRMVENHPEIKRKLYRAGLSQDRKAAAVKVVLGEPKPLPKLKTYNAPSSVKIQGKHPYTADETRKFKKS